jgi:hypothetical protein
MTAIWYHWDTRMPGPFLHTRQDLTGRPECQSTQGWLQGVSPVCMRARAEARVGDPVPVQRGIKLAGNNNP